MRCLHPHCPMGNGAPDWQTVVCSQEANIRASDQAAMLDVLSQYGQLGHSVSQILYRLCRILQLVYTTTEVYQIGICRILFLWIVIGNFLSVHIGSIQVLRGMETSFVLTAYTIPAYKPRTYERNRL